MIGEIRDLETAQIAVRASLTGHLVFSTLHTNDACSAFTRLIDMGLERFWSRPRYAAYWRKGSFRKLCPACAAEGVPPTGELAEEFRPVAALLRGGEPKWRQRVGCRVCHGTGFKGRLAIFEVVPMIAPLQEAVFQHTPAHTVAKIAREAGCRSLRQDGLLKAAAGITSIDEVMRVTGLNAAD